MLHIVLYVWNRFGFIFDTSQLLNQHCDIMLSLCIVVAMRYCDTTTPVQYFQMSRFSSHLLYMILYKTYDTTIARTVDLIAAYLHLHYMQA